MNVELIVTTFVSVCPIYDLDLEFRSGRLLFKFRES